MLAPGSVCRSTDSGTTWTAVNTGLTDAWVTSLAINPATPSTLYAGTEGGICRSTDSGTTWTVVNSGLNGAVLSLAINPLTSATLYSGTDDGIFRSTDGGDHWSATGLTGQGGVRSLAINPATPTTLYAGTNGGGVFRSTDGGDHWTATGLNGMVLSLAINPLTPVTLYAGTWGGGVFRSTDSGANWAAVNTGLTLTNVLSLSIKPLTPATLYAGTDDGVFQYDVVSSYALTTTASPSSGGTITKSPDQSSYAPGTIVTLTAIPAAGYTFTGWEWNKSDSPTIPPTVTMDADKTVTATFTAIPTYTLTPSASLWGTITPNTVQTVLQGGSITFIIAANTGFHIAEFSVDGVLQENISSYTFSNVTSNHNIDVKFEQDKKQTIIVLQIGNSMFTVNGTSKTLDSPPVIKNGRTLVPIRTIIEALGGTVGWDGTARKATVTLGRATIELWIGKNAARVNGVTTPIDAANVKVVPEIINGRTMLPLRFVSENLGCSVVWVDATKTITITYLP
ncbi:MAG: stalk domain-containing protein [Caldiserica bacterium]|nr:stalk domain-containing protein [Caldisericota bacterium]